MIAVLESISILGAQLRCQRRYDLVLDLGGGTLRRIECKSWRPDKIEQYTKQYLGVSGRYMDELAEDAAELGKFKEEGAQLFSDILLYMQNKGSVKWVFDETMTDVQKTLFRKTVKEALENNQALRNKMMSSLNKRPDDFDVSVEKFVDGFDDFFMSL